MSTFPVTSSEASEAALVEATVRKESNVWRAAFRKPGVILSTLWLLIIFVGTYFAQWLAPQNPLTQDLYHQLSLPSFQHLLGTDELGRDILSRLMYGGSGVITAAIIATVIGVALSIPAGLAAGYFGGAVDQVVDFVINLLYAVPGFIIIVVVAFLTNNNIYLISVVLGVTFAAGITRIVRASTQSTRDLLYVDAAKVSGMSRLRIMARHIFPNITGPLVVQSFFSMGVAFIVLTSLSFLGLGFSPQTPSWGRMIYDGSQELQRSPWQVVPIGFVLILTIVILNYLGSVVRSLLPQSQRVSLLRPVFSKRQSLRRAAEAQVDPGKEAAGRATGPTVTDSISASAALRDEPEGISRGQRLVVFDSVSIAFRDETGYRKVVDNVSFDVVAGETLALVGESGSGKTMTAYALAGLLVSEARLSGKRMSFAGRDLLDISERERNELRGTSIGLISQEPMVALDPSFTVGSVIREVLRAKLRMSRAEAKTEALRLIRLMGISDAAAMMKKHPHELSGGLAQRAAIALALAGRPTLLIADEPTTALDVTIQAEILDLLRQLGRDLGMTVIIVTHDFGVVADIATRVAVMYAGRIVELGSVEEVVNHPQHAYTAKLLAAAYDYELDPNEPNPKRGEIV